MWAKTKIIELGHILGQRIWHFGAHIRLALNKNLLNRSKVWLVSLLLISSLSLAACSDRASNSAATPGNLLNTAEKTSGKAKKGAIAEVSAPDTIQKLNRLFDRYEPQLKILSPQADQLIADTNVSVKLEVKDLPIFKDAQFGLGSHVQVLLDNQTVKSTYDLSQPLMFEDLSVGTHTLRAFVVRPWNESFKNEGAYAQATFHVYSKTGENTPSPQVPLLSYGYPLDQVGTEPVLLDFQLHNAPLHLAAIADENLTDWRIQVSLNEDSFLIDQWQPIYLKGLKPGKNLVKLELLDAKGAPILNQFNSTAKLINYQPGAKDSLSRLFRNEAIAGIEAIVDPNYKENLERTNQAASISSSIAAQNLSASVSSSISLASSISASTSLSVSQSLSQSSSLANDEIQTKKELTESQRNISESLSASLSQKESSASVRAIKSEAPIQSPSTEAKATNKSEPPVFTSSTARPIQSNPAESNLGSKSNVQVVPQAIPQAGAQSKIQISNASQNKVKTASASKIIQSLSAEPKFVPELIKSEPQTENSKPESLSWFEKVTQKRIKSFLPSTSISQPALKVEPEVSKEIQSQPKPLNLSK